MPAQVVESLHRTDAMWQAHSTNWTKQALQSWGKSNCQGSGYSTNVNFRYNTNGEQATHMRLLRKLQQKKEKEKK
jgi:hypothetical protein